MKNLLKVTAAALLLTSSIAFANDKETKETESFKMSMYFDQNSGKLKTFYEKAKGNILSIKVLDINGKQLMNTSFGKKVESSRLNIDLNNLKDGKYYLEVSSNGEKTVKELNIDTKPSVKDVKF